MSIPLPPPFTLLALDRIGSTNDEARARARSGAGHGLVVTAAEQSAGRGRRGRSWFSPRGNLHCSVLLNSGPDPARAAELAFVGAVALRDALAVFAPAARFVCKWPNDILADGAKIAGMLLENEPPWVILGVGVNLIAAPADAVHPAVSLAALGPTVAPDGVLQSFIAGLKIWHALWTGSGFAPIRQAWLERAGGLGTDILVRLADSTTLAGRFSALDEQGALLLDLPEGSRRRILAGDVFFAA